MYVLLDKHLAQVTFKANILVQSNNLVNSIEQGCPIAIDPPVGRSSEGRR